MRGLVHSELGMGKLEEVEQQEEGEQGEELVNRVSDLHVNDVVEPDVGEIEEDEADEVLVGLGFVQPVEYPWKVLRQHFPSKVGGCPAWLAPINIPSGDQSTCGICDSPLQFLLQVYAPVDEQDDAFHRTMYVFICPNLACLQQDQHHQSKHQQPSSSSSEKICRSVKVFRSQLPRTNSFYSFNPPIGEDDLPSCEGSPLCTWCGTWKGLKACAACKQARYCSRNHQVEHWRGGHSGFCRQVQAARKESGVNDSVSNKQDDANDFSAAAIGPVSDKLWPELELLVDEEDNYAADVDGTMVSLNNESLSRSKAHVLLEDYERRRKDGEEFTATDMQDVQEASQELQQWATFQARIARAPAQVLRYCRSIDAKPLWPLLEGQPKNGHIPPCLHCGSPRTFELQILPQLLYFLQVKNEPSSLDWATIAIYSCEKSCTAGVSKGYAEEFAWVQLQG